MNHAICHACFAVSAGKGIYTYSGLKQYVCILCKTNLSFRGFSHFVSFVIIICLDIFVCVFGYFSYQAFLYFLPWP